MFRLWITGQPQPHPVLAGHALHQLRQRAAAQAGLHAQAQLRILLQQRVLRILQLHQLAPLRAVPIPCLGFFDPDGCGPRYPCHFLCIKIHAYVFVQEQLASLCRGADGVHQKSLFWGETGCRSFWVPSAIVHGAGMLPCTRLQRAVLATLLSARLSAMCNATRFACLMSSICCRRPTALRAHLGSRTRRGSRPVGA